MQAADGGLALDGATGWLGAPVAGTDCLADPGKCPKGLAVGMRIKLDPSALSYADAKYLIDTGAQADGKRGLSVYVVGGKLHFDVATADKVWQVGNDSLVWL